MRNTFLGAILFFITLLPESTLAEAVDVDGGLTITISALPGFCNERARDVLDSMQRLSPKSKVLALSLPCDEMAEIKAGKRGLGRYIVWFVEAANGVAFHIPPQYTRSEYAKGLAQASTKVDLAEMAAEANKNTQAQTGASVSINNYGLIERDQDAVYFVSTENVKDADGSTRVMVGVQGMVAIHHFSFSITAYDQFKGKETFTSLLDEVKALMKTALDDNVEK